MSPYLYGDSEKRGDGGVMDAGLGVSEYWAAFMLQWSWKALLVIGAAAIAARTARRRPAAERHLFWLTVVLTVVALPLLSRVFESLPLKQPAAQRLSRFVQVPAIVESADSPTPPQGPAGKSAEVPIAQILFAAWTGGLIVIAVRLLRSHRSWRGVRERARRVTFPEIPLPVGYSTEIQTPLLAGLFRPIILIPAHLEIAATDEERRSVILHELAHFKRRDHWVNVLQSVCGAILFFHPAVRYALRQLSIERELACDEAVLALDVRPSAYAGALLKVVERSLVPLDTRYPAFGSSRKILERRMDMILNPPKRPATSSLRRLFAVARIAAISGLVALLLLPQAAAIPVQQPIFPSVVSNLGVTGPLQRQDDSEGGRAVTIPEPGIPVKQLAAAAVPAISAIRQAPPAAAAQAQTGRIVVKVFDATAALVPGVGLTLSGPNASTVSAATDRLGTFTFSDLPPGSYELRAQSPGFQTHRLTSLVVRSGADSPVNITLAAAVVATNVEVIASRRDPAAGVPPPPPPPPPTRIGGDIHAPRLILMPKPVYPAEARQKQVQDYVMLQATVSKEGTLRDIKVLRGHALLDAAALEAVTQWRYSPATLNGTPIEVVTTITVNFSLTD